MIMSAMITMTMEMLNRRKIQNRNIKYIKRHQRNRTERELMIKLKSTLSLVTFLHFVCSRKAINKDTLKLWPSHWPSSVDSRATIVAKKKMVLTFVLEAVWENLWNYIWANEFLGLRNTSVELVVNWEESGTRSVTSLILITLSLSSPFHFVWFFCTGYFDDRWYFDTTWV